MGFEGGDQIRGFGQISDRVMRVQRVIRYLQEDGSEPLVSELDAEFDEQEDGAASVRKIYDRQVTFAEIVAGKEKFFERTELSVARTLRRRVEQAARAFVQVEVPRFGLRIANRGYREGVARAGAREGTPEEDGVFRDSTTSSTRGRESSGRRTTYFPSPEFIPLRGAELFGENNSKKESPPEDESADDEENHEKHHPRRRQKLKSPEFHLLERGVQGEIVAIDAGREGCWVKFDHVLCVTFVDYLDLVVFFAVSTVAVGEGGDESTEEEALRIPMLSASKLDNLGFGWGEEARKDELIRRRSLRRATRGQHVTWSR